MSYHGVLHNLCSSNVWRLHFWLVTVLTPLNDALQMFNHNIKMMHHAMLSIHNPLYLCTYIKLIFLEEIKQIGHALTLISPLIDLNWVTKKFVPTVRGRSFHGFHQATLPAYACRHIEPWNLHHFHISAVFFKIKQAHCIQESSRPTHVMYSKSKQSQIMKQDSATKI